MKVRTVGALAALGMMLTSVTVWSWTPPGGFSATVPADPGPDDFTAGPSDVADRSQFSTSGVLSMEGRLGNAVLTSGKDNDTFVFVDVRADAQAAATTPSPLDLAIVVDRSGSMKGKRLQNALAAASGMIRRLREGDRVSVVAYNTSAEVVVPTATIGVGSREALVEVVEKITAGGDTCISCGITTAMNLLSNGPDRVNRILLLSDGEATAGVKDEPGFREIAARCRRMGTSITSIGVDVEYNERVMASLAQESNGRHFFVEDASGLPAVFDEELDSLSKTVAQSAEVVLDLAPGVEVVRVLDRSFRRDGTRAVVPMGSFAAGETKTVLAQIRVPRGAEGERAITDVRLSYSNLVSRAPQTDRGSLIAMMASDPAKATPLDALVSGRLSRSETASALERANELFASGRVDEARRELSKTRKDVARRASVSSVAAPAARKSDVDRDFQRQVAALDEAGDGFAAAPAEAEAPGAFAAPPAPAQETRKGKATVRRNQSNASSLGF